MSCWSGTHWPATPCGHCSERRSTICSPTTGSISPNNQSRTDSHDTQNSRGLLRRNPPDRLRRAAETLRRPGGRKPRGVGTDRRLGEPRRRNRRCAEVRTLDTVAGRSAARHYVPRLPACDQHLEAAARPDGGDDGLRLHEGRVAEKADPAARLSRTPHRIHRRAGGRILQEDRRTPQCCQTSRIVPYRRDRHEPTYELIQICLL